MRRSVVGLVIAGLVITLAVATLASPFASASPDGLEKVAADKELASGAEDHAFAGGPLADYGVGVVDNDRVGTGLAGLIGVAVTFAVGVGLFAVIKRVRTVNDPVPEVRRERGSGAAGP